MLRSVPPVRISGELEVANHELGVLKFYCSLKYAMKSTSACEWLIVLDVTYERKPSASFVCICFILRRCIGCYGYGALIYCRTIVNNKSREMLEEEIVVYLKLFKAFPGM
jgi:hypothetical protein